jgi:hypothetical protein
MSENDETGPLQLSAWQRPLIARGAGMVRRRLPSRDWADHRRSARAGNKSRVLT